MGHSGFTGQAGEWERFLKKRKREVLLEQIVRRVSGPPAVQAEVGVVTYPVTGMAPDHRCSKPPVKKKRGDREHREAVALMKLVDLNMGKYPKLELLYHQDNGRSTKAQGGKKKAEGVKAGVADYFLPVARAGYHGLFIELKAPGERPTADQMAFLVAMRIEGYAAEWAEGALLAWHTIEDYLLHEYKPRAL